MARRAPVPLIAMADELENIYMQANPVPKWTRKDLNKLAVQKGYTLRPSSQKSRTSRDSSDRLNRRQREMVGVFRDDNPIPAKEWPIRLYGGMIKTYAIAASWLRAQPDKVD